ncbi:MAG: hypothetical protein ACOCVK_02585 [bacterium]
MIAHEQETRTVYLSHAVEVPVGASVAFDYVRNDLGRVYTSIAPGHEYFTPTDGEPLHAGSVIDCAEHAGNQSIVHRYVVNDFDRPNRIQYSSCPSHLKVRLPWKTIASTSNTHVLYELERLGTDRSRIRVVIAIELHSRAERFFTRLVGGFVPWKRHCVEEMEGLKRMMVQECSETPVRNV